MARQNGLLPVQVNFGVVCALFERSPFGRKPPLELTLFHAGFLIRLASIIHKNAYDGRQQRS